MDIGGWLRGLGLERYEQAFRENEIDLRVLRKLTADDLKELGVAAIGHRRLLIDAISALTAEGEGAAADAAQATPARQASGEAERRQLTVMFCDLVGSTRLSTRFDPEDLREMVGAYHRCVTDTVARFGGFVAKYMGDGVLVYFGYPEAHEDDAERAVRAGLAVIDAVGRLTSPEPLNVRIGIATGLVVVGDLIGTGAAQERGVLGETPNLAARVQALAAPNTLVIAEATRRQIGGLFDLADLGPQALAGFAEPQPAWRGPWRERRVEPLRGIALGDDAARRPRRGAGAADPSLATSEDRRGTGGADLRRAGHRQVAAGGGAFRSYRKRAAYPAALFLLATPPGQRPLSLHRPARTCCRVCPRRYGRCQARQTAGTARPGTPDDDDIALLSELLSLPSSAADLNLSLQRKREMLFEALLNQLGAEGRHRPVLMVFEDAHWIDPTSREVLDLSVDRVRHLPVLLVITFRPEFQPPWGGRSHILNLLLNRLGERDGESLVQKLARNAALAPDIIAEIVERTDGVPLFVEELTKAVLESAAQGDRVAAVLAPKSLAALSVPPTLHAALMARLDRLGSAAKEIAQIGAVLGREFACELIEPVAQRPDRGLQAALDELNAAGLLFCRGTAPHASYLFKHALVQDAAYSTLLRVRRQDLHARVAAALEQHFPDLVERQPELLAHHLMAAGNAERGVDQWLKAGQHAAAQFAYLEAIAHFERGLSLLHSLPESPIRNGREIELQLALGLCLFTAKGALAAKPAHTRALELAESSGEPQQRFEALYGCGSQLAMTCLVV